MRKYAGIRWVIMLCLKFCDLEELLVIVVVQDKVSFAASSREPEIVEEIIQINQTSNCRFEQ